MKYAAHLLLLFVLTLPVRAAEFEAVSPESVGFDAKKLAAIDDAMQAHVDEGRIVGCSALVVRDGKVAYFRTWGDADREQQKPMTDDAIFRIYSMSKPITSVAVMQLVEQGKLDLDDPISKYLPELADMKVLVVERDDDGKETFEEVAAQREITPRDLLRHTSGFTYGFFGNSEVDKRYLQAGILRTGETIADMVSKLGKIPLKHQPGTRWEYSVSTDVLGRLVEVVSGERYDEYLNQHIFEPLKMTDTFFSVPRDKQDRLAQLYTGDGDKLKTAESVRSRRFVNPTRFFSGGGGLCSTAGDYLRFCQMMLNEGELDGARVLKPETVRQMITNQLTDDIQRRPGLDFGLGFAISPEGRYSWGGAAGTRFWIDPENKIIGQFMIQIIPYENRNFGDRMREMVYAALVE